MSGGARLSEVERNEVVFRFYDASTSEEAIETVERILAARLAAVPVPSETGLADAWERGYTAGKSITMRRMSDEPDAPDYPNPLLSERTAATGGGGS